MKFIFNQISRYIVFLLLKRAQNNYLQVTLVHSNKIFYFGHKNQNPVAKLSVYDESLFKDLLLNPGIGLAEGYMHFKWDTDNLFQVLDFFANNPSIAINNYGIVFFNHILRLLKNISKKIKLFLQSDERKDIRKHYDLSNDMFSLFLDSTMTYSCAIYNENDSLYKAQKNKYDLIINKLDITKNEKVLYIGFGWGGLCSEISNQTGCDVDGVTLSEAQYEYAKTNNSGQNILFEMKDFRKINKTYDKISSIEMLEALDYTKIGQFFEKIEEILNPGGKLFVQVITIPENRFNSYKNSEDFIQKYIFPGGMVHPLNRLLDLAEKKSTIKVIEINDISTNYVNTLNDWKVNFNKNINRINQLGFDDVFIRKWNYYFDYCAAGFKNNLIGNSQILFSKPLK